MARRRDRQTKTASVRLRLTVQSRTIDATEKERRFSGSPPRPRRNSWLSSSIPWRRATGEPAAVSTWVTGGEAGGRAGDDRGNVVQATAPVLGHASAVSRPNPRARSARPNGAGQQGRRHGARATRSTAHGQRLRSAADRPWATSVCGHCSVLGGADHLVDLRVHGHHALRRWRCGGRKRNSPGSSRRAVRAPGRAVDGV